MLKTTRITAAAPRHEGHSVPPGSRPNSRDVPDPDGPRYVFLAMSDDPYFEVGRHCFNIGEFRADFELGGGPLSVFPNRSYPMVGPQGAGLYAPASAMARFEYPSRANRAIARETPIEPMAILVQLQPERAGEMVALIEQVCQAVASGRNVRVVSDDRDTDLTSQQVADLLNVSRPHVVKLARTGKLAHHMVGTHHRFKAEDVDRYLVALHGRRDDALRALAADGYQDGDF